MSGGVILAFIDQLTKIIIIKKMITGQSIPVLKGILHFTYTHNSGIAFGLLPNLNKVIVILSIVTIFILLYIYSKFEDDNIWLKAGIISIFGGALGNLIDRIKYKVVIDFIDFKIWPVFNLADVFIIIGVGIIFVILFFKEEEKTNVSDSP